MTFVRVVPGVSPGACPPHLDGDGAPPDRPRSAAERRCQRWTLIVVCVATALMLFNVTAPNVALPSIARDLHASFGEQQWVLSAYALVLASLLLASGALGDRYGRKRGFTAGLAVFSLGSLLCAAAPSASVLIFARALQGLGGALLFPSALALIAAEHTGAERARAIGIWGASVSAAIAAGPLVGGLLVQALGWRAVFAVGAALALPIGALGTRHLRESRDPAVGAIDWIGTGLLTGAAFLLVFVLLRGNDAGWESAATLGLGALGVALLATFVVVEHRIAAPLIAPALMRNGTFVGATLVALVFAAAGFSPIVFLTLYLLDVLGFSPVAGGAVLVPFAAASFVVALAAAPVARRIGVRATLAGGLLLCSAGLLLMHGITPDSSWTRLVPGLLVFGAGGGLVNPTMTVAALSVVSPAHSGMASGVNNTARQLGIAAGIAGLGAYLQSREAAAASAGAGPGQAFSSALNDVLLLAGGFALAGVAIVLVLIRGRRAARAGEPAVAEA